MGFLCVYHFKPTTTIHQLGFECREVVIYLCTTYYELVFIIFYCVDVVRTL